MVHALKETWRVLRKNGLLIDLRPLRDDVTIEAIVDDHVELISRYTDEYRQNKDKAANEAIAVVSDENWFHLEASAPFEYVKLYDTGEELLEYYAARNPPIEQPDEVIAKIKMADNNPNMGLRVATSMLLKTYRRLD